MSASPSFTLNRGLTIGGILLVAIGVLVMLRALSGWTGIPAAQANLTEPAETPAVSATSAPAEYSIRVPEVTIVTPFGVRAEMPVTTTTVNADGTFLTRAVTWKTVNAMVFVAPGLHEVLGTLDETGQSIVGHIRVFDPEHTISVAAVGDSITMGYGLIKPLEESYPARLGGMLGSNFSVSEYGASGTTALSSGDYPYVNDALYGESLAADPDVVLLQLGTNDSKAWNWQRGYELIADYRALIDSYRNLPSKPTIYAILPPSVQAEGAFGITDAGVTDVIREILAAVGTDAFSEVTLIDNNTPTRNASTFFTDAVHPNATGAHLLADSVARHMLGREYGG